MSIFSRLNKTEKDKLALDAKLNTVKHDHRYTMKVVNSVNLPTSTENVAEGGVRRALVKTVVCDVCGEKRIDVKQLYSTTDNVGGIIGM